MLGNLVFLAMLYACPVGFRNLQLPEAAFASNLWAGSDVMTYVEPARNFLVHGVFGDAATPDYHRTIGYPLFLAGCMALFGAAWVVGAQLAQALLFALAYPALDLLLRTLAPGIRARPALCFVAVAGTYWATSPALLTDLFFAVFLLVGLACGAAAVLRHSWLLCLVQIAFLGYAAQVRPTLVLFALVYLPLLLALAARAPEHEPRKARALVAASVLAIGLLGNGPSLRNWVNHGFFHPSDALEVNLWKQLSARVAHAHGEDAAYTEQKQAVDAATGFRDWVTRQRAAARDVLERHPLTAARLVAVQALAVLGSTHLMKAANLWGWHWADNPAARLHGVAALRLLNLASFVVYALVETLFLLWLWRLWHTHQRLFAVSLLALCGYFLLPAFVDAAGARMRLPVEALLVVGAVAEAQARRALSR